MKKKVKAWANIVITFVFRFYLVSSLSQVLIRFFLFLNKTNQRILLFVNSRLPSPIRRSVRSNKFEYFKLVLRYLNHISHIDKMLRSRPKISVLVPVYKVKAKYLREALQSIVFQTYENWEICLVDDCSQDSALISIYEEFAKKFPEKFKFKINAKNCHISITSNECLSLATGEYVALLDHDDRLYPNSLFEVARYINYKNNPDILYSDERTVDENGFPINDPFCKPDWSPYLHLSVNYTTHFSVYKTELVKKIGGFREGFEGSQDHDLMLRMVDASSLPVVHIPMCLYQWRAHPLSTASSTDSKPYAAAAGEKAVKDALARRGVKASVTYEPHTVHYRIKFEIPVPSPLVSVIIPNKDSFNFVEKCLNSLFKKSTYKNFEVVIVDNGSTDESTLALYDELISSRSNFRVVFDIAPFNFAKMNNIGAEQARGEYLILLNNDTEVITPGWIEELLGLAMREEVGAVGCKLLFEDNFIQHAGILMFPDLPAVHAGIGAKRNQDFYFNIVNTMHECVAVTAACLMISKRKFLEIGGLDEVWYPNGYGDVEFCLRLRRAGYSNIYTPYAELYHFESASRKENIEYFERIELQKSFSYEIANDPYFSPNLHRTTYYIADHEKLLNDLPPEIFNFFMCYSRNEWSESNFKKFKK